MPKAAANRIARTKPAEAVRRARRASPSRLQAHTAAQIVALIRDHDLPAGHHLREEALARQLSVSRTSIRAGLRILKQQGLLAVRPRRGYRIIRRPDEVVADLPISADEMLYLRIARERVANRLPSSVTETSLMRRFGCGRNLVMAALAILSEESLVRRGRGREWRFHDALNSPEARQHSYELRLLLEPAALLLPAFRTDATELALLRERQLALLSSDREIASWRQVFEFDARFHEFLARCSGNDFILEAIRRQNRLRRLMEYESYPDVDRLRAGWREHLDVIEALLDGDRALASHRLANHLRKAMLRTTGRMAEIAA